MNSSNPDLLNDDRNGQLYKLGSYRGTNSTATSSSKFSDRFTNIMPMITSKFHHSLSKGKIQGNPAVENKLVSSVINGSSTINSPHDIIVTGSTPESASPVQFPGTSSNASNANNNNTLDIPNPIRSRPRTNTVPVQWGVNLPNLARSGTNYSEISIWSDNNIETGRKRSQSMATYDAPQIVPPHVTTPSMMPMSYMPFMQDDVEPNSFAWVCVNQKNVPPINSVMSLPPSNVISISNIFPLQRVSNWNNIPNLTSVTIGTLFSQFGKIISVRTLKNLYVALIEFETIENSLLAMETMQDKEISIVGVPVKISFAQILSFSEPLHNPNGNNGKSKSSKLKPQSMMDEMISDGHIKFQLQPNGLQIPMFNDQYNPTMVPAVNQLGRTVTAEQETSPFKVPPGPILDHKDEILNIAKKFNEANLSIEYLERIVNHSFILKPCQDITKFGPLPEPISNREFQTPKLREIRKSLDNNLLTPLEIEELALAMLDELPELSLDYLGNTIVQRIYDKCGELVRDIILRRFVPYLNVFGIHKSGTWVCQKVIKSVSNARNISLVIDGIKPYCAALFNDQFGNYVIQEIIKFGPQWNQFIFDTIISNFWTICTNRYGVRAIRACLETNGECVTKEQLLVISGIIVCYGEYLITDHNGTLLITWLLDTSEFSKKYILLTEHILPYLGELCCHKLGSLTILKILNSRGNDESKKKIIDEIFELDNADMITELLRYILRDSTMQGPRFVYKMVTSRLVLNPTEKEGAMKKIRTVLLEEKPPYQHHRLMEEVGLVNNTAVSNIWG